MRIQSIKERNKTNFKSVQKKQFAIYSVSLESGFSLIELLASITIFLTCIATAYGLLEVARASRSTVNQQVQTMQSARSALNALGRDISNAGYGDFRQSGNGALLKNGALSNLLGIPVAAADYDHLPTMISGNNLTQNSLSGEYTDQITLMYQDTSFNNNQSLSVFAGGINSNGNVVIVNSLTPFARVNDLVVISGSTNSAIGMVTQFIQGVAGTNVHFSNNDPLGFNNVRNGGPIDIIGNQPASYTRIVLLTYRVLPNGTLVRTVYGNNPSGNTRASQIQDSPLVQNVENMQIEYILSDGTVSSNPFATAPLSPGVSQSQAAAKMQTVRQVKITLTLQSSQKDLRDNQPTKLILDSTFSTRNMTYDRS